jgi:hypothetical protein
MEVGDTHNMFYEWEVDVSLVGARSFSRPCDPIGKNSGALVNIFWL